jgi:hypothetical protein
MEKHRETNKKIMFGCEEQCIRCNTDTLVFALKTFNRPIVVTLFQDFFRSTYREKTENKLNMLISSDLQLENLWYYSIFKYKTKSFLPIFMLSSHKEKGQLEGLFWQIINCFVEYLEHKGIKTIQLMREGSAIILRNGTKEIFRIDKKVKNKEWYHFKPQ